VATGVADIAAARSRPCDDVMSDYFSSRAFKERNIKIQKDLKTVIPAESFDRCWLCITSRIYTYCIAKKVPN
jgi:IMP cyclohydrolase